MRRADVARSEHAPLRIEPCLGQLSENGPEVPVSKETWHVLQEREARSYSANDPNRLGPEVPLVVSSELLSGRAERLAGKSAGDDIDAASPRRAVERADVIVDLEGGEDPVSLSGEEHGAAVGVLLDGADRSPSEQHGSIETAACACEQRQLTHANPCSKDFEALPVDLREQRRVVADPPLRHLCVFRVELESDEVAA